MIPYGNKIWSLQLMKKTTQRKKFWEIFVCDMFKRDFGQQEKHRSELEMSHPSVFNLRTHLWVLRTG